MNQQLQQMEQKREADQLEFQKAIAQAETQKAQATMANVQMKGQVEEMKLKLAAMEGQEGAKIDLLKQQLAEMTEIISAKENSEEMQFKYWDRTKYYTLEYERLEAKEKTERSKQTNGPKAVSNG